MSESSEAILAAYARIVEMQVNSEGRIELEMLRPAIDQVAIDLSIQFAQLEAKRKLAVEDEPIIRGKMGEPVDVQTWDPPTVVEKEWDAMWAGEYPEH